MVLRYRDGRSDRGYLRDLGRGVVRVGILRSGAPALEAALPLAMVEAIYFVADLHQPALQSLGERPPRPSPAGKPIEVHLARWSVKGTRVQSDAEGFFLVPADLHSNAELIFFPEGAAQLVETGDLPSPPVDELDPFAGALAEEPPRPLTPRARAVSAVDSEPPTVSRSAPRTAPRAPSPVVAPAAFPPVVPPVSLPPLEVVIPLGSAPLLPAEVEALIAFDAPRPPTASAGALGFWQDPWAVPVVLRSGAQAPEQLLPFAGSMDLPILPPAEEEDDLEIEIEEADGSPPFAHAVRDLVRRG